MKNNLSYLAIAACLIASSCSKNDPVQDKPMPVNATTAQMAELNPSANGKLTAAVQPFIPIKGAVQQDFYRIRNVHSHRFLDVKDRSTSNGALLQQWDENTEDQPKNQVFFAAAQGTQGFTVGTWLGGGNIDIKDQSNANGAVIQLWQQTNGNNQKWRFVEKSPGLYFIENVGNGKVLDVKDNSTNNGAQIQLWDKTGADNQLFELSHFGVG